MFCIWKEEATEAKKKDIEEAGESNVEAQGGKCVQKRLVVRCHRSGIYNTELSSVDLA